MGEGLPIHAYTDHVLHGLALLRGKEALGLGEVAWDIVGCSGDKYEMYEVPAASQGATQTEQELIWKAKVFRTPLSSEKIKALLITSDFTFPNKAESFPKYFKGR